LAIKINPSVAIAATLFSHKKITLHRDFNHD